VAKTGSSQHLFNHFALKCAHNLNQEGECGFAAVDMGDNREVADICDRGGRHGWVSARDRLGTCLSGPERLG
jgi:hypothetical protein